MGSRGALYLPGATRLRPGPSAASARWAIIAATCTRLPRNVGSRIVKLPLLDARRRHPGRRRVARPAAAAEHDAAHRRAALAVLLPLHAGRNRNRPALRLGASPQIRFHAAPGAGPLPAVAADRPAGRHLHVAADQPHADAAPDAAPGRRRGRHRSAGAGRRTQHLEGRPVSLRDLPSVDRLLQAAAADGVKRTFGRQLTLQALKTTLEEARTLIRQGGHPPAEAALLAAAVARLEGWVAPSLRPVINATGVIVHTNLGRAPLSPAALQTVLEVASSFNTLEFDLDSGGRGSRQAHTEALLCRLLEAEAALVVNNNAAAVLLALTALARKREVVISRSQLVEIGGGFRVPDVLRESGARLVEVGTTNRTHRRDFEDALTPRTALLLRAHHSNFRITGFTAEPGLDELVDIARRHGLPVVDDLGSGALLDTSDFGLAHEPTVQESLRCGAALVAFSGDKLLGGPQSGILVGERAFIERLRRHPLAR
ncbi:MAG: L-seryl-tRNA(Sec) selenium transferase, partial [Chloroflexi bacterium]|nr:L-seryl-tRNA(Sec) selenium transferase [Chloroflexota bacterium]